MPSIKRLYGTFGPCGDFNLELQCEKLQPHSKNVDLNDGIYFLMMREICY